MAKILNFVFVRAAFGRVLKSFGYYFLSVERGEDVQCSDLPLSIRIMSTISCPCWPFQGIPVHSFKSLLSLYFGYGMVESGSWRTQLSK